MSNQIDVSIIIVHTFEGKQLRQTLRSIRRIAPAIQYEVIVVDNNPAAGFFKIIRDEFPDTVYIPLKKNKGFGGGMNEGIRVAKGGYVFIFNPDIQPEKNSLEELVHFMDDNEDVGIVGPKLLNTDGSLQYSCYRIPTFLIPLYRRTPLGKLPSGKKSIEKYLMINDDHSKDMDVDSLIGAALFTRKNILEKVGLFDEQFFMYFEDNDLCRRFWENDYRVVYHPKSVMKHYHNRASAKGGLLKSIFNRFTWIHLSSFAKYYLKYRRASNPRIVYNEKHVH